MPYNADDFKPMGIAMKAFALALSITICWINETWASSPGGDVAGTIFGKEVALARKCGFDKNEIEYFEANQVKALTLSNATKIYIKDALKAFFLAAQDEGVTVSTEKCQKIDVQMKSMETRYKEGN